MHFTFCEETNKYSKQASRRQQQKGFAQVALVAVVVGCNMGVARIVIRGVRSILFIHSFIAIGYFVTNTLYIQDRKVLVKLY